MEQNGIRWCWWRLQSMQSQVCQGRIHKGVCALLNAPEKLDKATATFFNVEGETYDCREVNTKRQKIRGD